MNTNPFNLQYVIQRVNLEPNSKVEVLELKVGILYIGTTDGWLLQYGLAERRDEHGNQILEANFIQSKNVGEKSKITFIHAAPEINTVLVVCSGNLYILSMADLTPRTGYGQKLKGICACAVNPSHADQFSVQFCVARKKQLTMYTMSEEKITAMKPKEVPEPVVNMCVDGNTVCAALPSRYILLHYEAGQVIDLFPIEENSPSLAITRIQEQEFLLAGPGNLGMFVTSVGTSIRPPIQWSANLYRIIYSFPYILGLSPNSVMVYSITDQKLKQGLPYSGGRTIGAFDGTILVAGSSHVSALLPVPWQVQAEKLIEKEDVDDVLQLIDTVMKTPSLSQESLDEIRVLRQKAGFICLTKGHMARASDLLISGRTDVREILSLFPGMLSASSTFVRQSPPLHNIPDISSIEPGQGESSALQFLLDYLQNLVEMEEYSPDHPEDVFTSITKLLCELNTAEFAAFLAKESIVLHYEELSDYLQAKGLHHFQALLHEKFQNLEAAYKLWSSLVVNTVEDTLFPGPDFFARKLCTAPDNLLWAHCDALLTTDQLVGARVFINHQKCDQQSFVDRALTTLSKYKEARKLYLEDLVFNKDSQVEKHHTLLALMLIESHTEQKESSSQYQADNLRKLILTSSHLNTEFLIDKLRETQLLYERAILHGRLKQYNQALDILVNNMKDHTLAMQFCDDIAAAKDREEKEKILFLLLNTYLRPAKAEDMDDFLVKAVDLINNRAADLNGSQVLNSLPDSWNMATILPAVKVFLRSQSHAARMAKLTKNLSKGENLQTRLEYVQLSSEPVYILPNNYCITCKKGFSEGCVSRYPNGVLVHEDCVVNRQICPVTGQVFSIS